jgi:DNA-binding SARP family transcriptional activator
VASLLPRAIPFTIDERPPAAPLYPDRAPGAAATLDAIYATLLRTERSVERLRRDTEAIQSLLASPERAGAAVPGSAPAPRAAVRVRLFGSFELEVGGSVLRGEIGRKARLLFAYLATEPGRRVPKDSLIEMFWPASAPRRGSNNLSIAVFQIRALLKQVFPPPRHGLLVQHGAYCLDDGPWAVDVAEFERALLDAASAEREDNREAARTAMLAAVALHRGVFLEADPFEEWTIPLRRAFAAKFGGALSWLAEDAARARDWKSTRLYSLQLLHHDNCDENAARWLMLAEWRLGNRRSALERFREITQRLEDELGVEPSAETMKLHQLIVSTP